MKRLLLTAITAALLAIPTGAQAMKVENIAGVTHYSDHVWSNQLGPGEPAAAFPLDCTDCDFKIWVDLLPGIGAARSAECEDDPDTSWWDCEPKPTCIAWIQFGDRITPMRSWHGRDNITGEQLQDNALLATAFSYSSGAPAIYSTIGVGPYIGIRYEMLDIEGSLEIYRNSVCGFGFMVRYHPNSKSVYEDGLLLP